MNANRIEEAKRAIKRPRSNDRYDDDRDRDRKRSTADSRRFEAPPPPRFDTASVSRYFPLQSDYSSDLREKITFSTYL